MRTLLGVLVLVLLAAAGLGFWGLVEVPHGRFLVVGENPPRLLAPGRHWVKPGHSRHLYGDPNPTLHYRTGDEEESLRAGDGVLLHAEVDLKFGSPEPHSLLEWYRRFPQHDPPQIIRDSLRVALADLASSLSSRELLARSRTLEGRRQLGYELTARLPRFARVRDSEPRFRRVEDPSASPP